MSNEERDALQNRVLIALKAACVAHPTQRVTQVIVNALGTDPFYMEDEEAEELLIKYINIEVSPEFHK